MILSIDQKGKPPLLVVFASSSSCSFSFVLPPGFVRARLPGVRSLVRISFESLSAAAAAFAQKRGERKREETRQTN